MFHKPDSSTLVKGKKSVDVPLKKSDRKKLLGSVKETLLVSEGAQESAPTNALLQSIFMEGTLTSRKLNHPQLNKVVLYFRSASSQKSSSSCDDDATPWPFSATTQCIWMTVDPGPSLELIHCPTVALLSVLPGNLPTVVVPSQTSKFLCRGAHLFKSGIVELPSTTPMNGIVAVCVHGNPQPFAVGKLASDFHSSDSGVGVEIWTCYGDDLWTQQLPSSSNKQQGGIVNPIGGASFDDGNYGNVGFIDGKIVKPITVVEETKEVRGVTDSQTSDAEEVETSNATDDRAEDEDDNNSTDKGNPNDAILHQAVCEALVNIKDSQLPMTSTNFYAQHVKPRASSPINVKETSWRKFNSYLQDQVDSGLLVCKPHNTDPMGYLVEINRRHEDLHGIKKDQALPNQQAKTKLAIVNLCVIPHHFIKLLRLDSDMVKAVNAKSVERQGTSMLTKNEAVAIIDDYITKNELASTSSQVQLDAALTDALFKKQSSPPERLSKKELYKLWLEKMENAYAFVEMPTNRILKLGRGASPKIFIEVSLRQGRKKYVTRVRGLEEYGIDPVAFSKEVTRRFACAATIETEPEGRGRASLKKGHVELEFQGHLVEELKALLLGDEKLTSHGGAKDSEYSLPKSSLDVVLKKNVPSKKTKKR